MTNYEAMNELEALLIETDPQGHQRAEMEALEGTACWSEQENRKNKSCVDIVRNMEL